MSPLRLLVPGLLALVFVAPATAEYRFDQHLFGNSIQDMTAEGDVLWWATHSGLVGLELADSTFTVFRRSDRGLPSDSLNAVAFDANGNLWCGTESEGLAIRLAGGGWSFLRTFDGLPSSRVLSLASSGDRMTVGTDQGFVVFVVTDGSVVDACTVIDPCVTAMPSLIIQEVMVQGGTTWLGTAAGPVEYVPGDAITPLRTRTDGLGSAVVRAFTEYEGNVWVGTDDGAYRYDDVAEAWIPTTGIETGGVTGDVQDFLVTDDRFLAASRTGRRVFEWTGTEWLNIPSSVFPVTAAPEALVELASGDVWLGTGNGVRRFLSSDWGPTIRLDGTPSNSGVWGIAAAGERVFLGYRASVGGWYDGDRWQEINGTSTGGAWESRFTQAIHVDGSDRVWFGHCCCAGGGCFADVAPVDDMSGDGWMRIPAENARSIVQDGAGRFFLGSGAEDQFVQGQGLYLWEESYGPDSVDVFVAGQAGFQFRSNTIGALGLDDQGRLWVGYRQDGIHMWDYGSDPRDGTGDRWTWFNEDADDDFWVISNQILSMAADGPRMWVGTALGVSVYENGVHRGSWGSSTLGNPFVSAMAVTSDGSAWAGTQGGVVRFVPNSLGTWDIERYAFPELSSDAINGMSAIGSTLWVATQRGVSVGTPVETPIGAGGTLLGAVYPNPFWPRSHDGVRLTDVTVPVEGAVYDASGAEVAKFTDVEPGAVIWDGRLRNGTFASPGLYAVVARSGNLTLTARIAVVR